MVQVVEGPQGMVQGCRASGMVQGCRGSARNGAGLQSVSKEWCRVAEGQQGMVQGCRGSA